MKALKAIAILRFKLLLRQRLGWLSTLGGFALIGTSWLFADVSFIKPQKIYWDFTLGSLFILATALSLYLGSQLFSDEKNRRTLHLVLSAGVSRTTWLWGNFLGISCIFFAAIFLWTLFSFLLNHFVYGASEGWLLVVQSQWFLFLESLVVLSLALLTGIFLRPLLALISSLSLVVLVHSVDSLRRIFTDPQSGRFIDNFGINALMWVSQLLPPLNWLNLRDFVGYEQAFNASFVLGLSVVSLLWVLIIMIFTASRLERMDL